MEIYLKETKPKDLRFTNPSTDLLNSNKKYRGHFQNSDLNVPIAESHIKLTFYKTKQSKDY